MPGSLWREYRASENGRDFRYFVSEHADNSPQLYLPGNLKRANDFVTNALAKLSIFKYFNIEEETIHGSIDGQKIDTQTNTINARHSPKYFGLRKGVASITLIANNIPVNARIIGAHEHESYFAYDLVFNNTSDVDPHIVSTDDHGI